MFRCPFIQIAVVASVAVANAGLVGSSGWEQAASGWESQAVAGWQQQAASTGWTMPQGWTPAQSSGWETANSGWQGSASAGWQPQSTGWAPASSGWQPAPERQELKKVLLVKEQRSHGNTGASLTVAGPTHLVKTLHHVRTVDQGGEILHKSGGGQHAKVVVLKSVGTAQVKHGQGWPQAVQSGWQSNGGW